VNATQFTASGCSPARSAPEKNARRARVGASTGWDLAQERPRHDPHGRARLADAADDEPFFLTDRGTPYTPRAREHSISAP